MNPRHWYILARTTPPPLIHGRKLDSDRPCSLGVCEQVERALVQLDHAIACGGKFYELGVLVFEIGRDKSQREEKEGKDWSPQHPEDGLVDGIYATCPMMTRKEIVVRRFDPALWAENRLSPPSINPNHGR